MGMEVRTPGDIETYLSRSEGWLLKYGFSKLPDRGLVEDAVQELMAWALARLARGRTFNSHYLGLRYLSLLRDARREWLLSLPAMQAAAETSVERRMDSRRVLALVVAHPNAELAVDAIELGVAQAAARHGISIGAVHVRMHRLRARFADLAPARVA